MARILVNARFGVKKTGIGKVIEGYLCELEKIDDVNEYYIFVNKDHIEAFKFSNKNFKILSNSISSKNVFLNHLWTWTAMFWHARQKKIDLIFLPSIVFFWRSKFKSILIQHDLIEYYINSQQWYKLLFRKITFPITFKSVTKIVCVSNNTLEDMQKIFQIQRSKLVYIPNGLAREKKYLTKSNMTNFYAKHDIKSQFMLYVGTLTEPQKNLVRVIQAFNIVASNDSSIDLVLVGNKGKGFANIEKEIDSSLFKSRIKVLGYLSDDVVCRLYKDALFFVFPSQYEGFGLPILEAMSHGCPVLTSDSSSLYEVAVDAAVLVDCKSVDSIAKGMTSLLTSEKRREYLREKGTERSKDYSWKSSSLKLLELIDTTINKS